MLGLETLESALNPWAEWYSHTKPAQVAVEFLHVGGLLVGGGFALASDRAVLRALPSDLDQRKRVLRELSTIHTPVVLALGVSAISGVLLLASDVGTFIGSPVYWTKMTLVLLLLANGCQARRCARRLTRDLSPGNGAWPRLDRKSTRLN